MASLVLPPREHRASSFCASAAWLRRKAFFVNYQESLDYILGTPNPGGVYERNVMDTLMHELGDPHKD